MLCGFRTAGSPQSEGESNFPKEQLIQSLDKRWQVTFEDGKNSPNSPVEWASLQDWATHIAPAIRYYSGAAQYETSFDFSSDATQPVYLDLGQVMVMATVELNGQPIGGVWTPPYRLNVTDYLQKGENRLKVTVVNNWKNRLIGDQQLPEEQRTTQTLVNPWTKSDALQSSGLLGPVKLITFSDK